MQLAFAAASLTDAFTAIGEQYMAEHPRVHVTFNFAGSQDLATQIEQGAPADVLATADEATMRGVAALVGEPRSFAANQLQIAVAPGNPLGYPGPGRSGATRPQGRRRGAGGTGRQVRRAGSGRRRA